MRTPTTRMWTPRLVLVLAALLALGGLWWSAASASPRTVAEQTRDVAQTLRCPTCLGEDVADSPSPVAVAMRQVISEQLHGGRSPHEIRAWFAERYGDGVLLDPPRRGLGWVMWALPLALLGVAIAVTARRSTGSRSTGSWRRLPLVAAAGVLAIAVVAVSWEALSANRPVPVAADQPAVSAADVLGHAASDQPGDAQLQIALARALAADGRSAEAVEHYAIASRLRPMDADLASLHATELVRAGNLDEATQVLKNTLAAQPDHAPSLLLLGTLLHRAGDETGAVLLERFLELTPEHPAAGDVRRLLSEPR